MKKYAMLVKVDGANNNNKFYEITWNDDDSVTARYGRNGDQGVTEHKGYGEAAFNKVYKAKTSASKGYKEVDVLKNSEDLPQVTQTNTSSLIEIAKRDVTKNNPLLEDLIARLTKINKYQLLQATGDQIDIVDGVVKTVLGPVTLDAVEKARQELISLKTFIDKNDFSTSYGEHLNNYLSCIPQKVPRKRGWDSEFFTVHSTFEQQSGLLDQIESSIKSYKPVKKDDNVVNDEPQKIFGHSLEVLEDGKTFDEIKKFYESNMNSRHVCSHLKLKKVYVVSNPEGETKYKNIANKIGNEQRLWHGTRAFNVLSILKNGLIIPTSAGGYHITGRMFGDGLYFSDQSTKSLNYAYGYWGGGGYDTQCFMFLANVAMGKSYVPPGPLNRIPSGYDSCYAIGGKSGVQNNEMIVYNIDQANLAYLCEFDK